ncbi:hypothetical protein EPA93_01040 [Ktedonosporobacter rubrisoli]|uniref:Resolvase HTH domain-containing protein n=1 Tax=Ktedonosporobacter rubrisoli TaxID=2509675 RepID=A0A4P6JID7_KTERU|nr:helix-turn-helix domain-containing protein [Ktedonosporobacter rubrisoli]QBD74650.1 hypothetical protein EPA93_01040 [Ktedonosporobacter rubrisoli]
MRAYSQDLLWLRMLHTVDQGTTCAEIIELFAVSRSTIKRYLKLRRETGDVKPKAIAGRSSEIGAAFQAGRLSYLDAPPLQLSSSLASSGKPHTAPRSVPRP